MEQLGNKNANPRTKAWKVTVPYKFKEMMEKDELYPCGWTHRKFHGTRSSENNRKTRADDALVRQVLQEVFKERERIKEQEMIKQAEEERHEQQRKKAKTDVSEESEMDIGPVHQDSQETS